MLSRACVIWKLHVEVIVIWDCHTESARSKFLPLTIYQNEEQFIISRKQLQEVIEDCLFDLHWTKENQQNTVRLVWQCKTNFGSRDKHVLRFNLIHGIF